MPNDISFPTFLSRADAARKARYGVDNELKVCSMCDRPRELKYFQSRNAMCTSCSSNKVVTCSYRKCKNKRATEPSMGIYVVVDDKYYCGQGCFDKQNGLSRKELNGWQKEKGE